MYNDSPIRPNVFSLNYKESRYYCHIFGDSVYRMYGVPDTVLAETARALFCRRLPSDSGDMRIEFCNLNFEQVNTADYLMEFFGRISAPYRILFGSIYSIEAPDFEDLMLAWDRNGNAEIQHTVVESFGHRFHIFNNVRYNYVTIISHYKNQPSPDRILHTIAANLDRMFPGLFSADPLSKEEQALLALLKDEDMTLEQLRQQLQTLYDAIDFREMFISDFERFENRITEKIILSVEHEIDNKMRYCRDLRESYLGAMRAIEDLREQIAGIKHGSGHDHDLVEVFRNNPMLSIATVNNESGCIDFDIRCDLDFYDPDEFMDAYNNADSPIYAYNDEITNRTFDTEHLHNRRALLRALFTDEILKLQTTMDFSINMIERTYSVNSRGCDSHGRMPNPHLYHYSCLGGNEMDIEKYIAQRRYADAIMQLIVATRNINFSDLTVLERFVTDLFENYASLPCIVEKKTGRLMSPDDAVAYLREIGYLQDDDYCYDRQTTDDSSDEDEPLDEDEDGVF